MSAYYFQSCNSKFGINFVVSLLEIVAKYLLMERKGIMCIVMHKDSTATDVLQSFFHANAMANLKDKRQNLHSESQTWMDKHYQVFMQKVVLVCSFYNSI